MLLSIVRNERAIYKKETYTYLPTLLNIEKKEKIARFIDFQDINWTGSASSYDASQTLNIRCLVREAFYLLVIFIVILNITSIVHFYFRKI